MILRTYLDVYIFGSSDPVPPVEEQPPTEAPLPTSTLRPVTTLKPLVRRPPPRPEDGCALAYDPYYVTGDPDEGYRFGKNYFITFSKRSLFEV